ncbi:DUF2946 family protein [Variovorax sp. DT-64]|uniref:DUF2946 family protein n=1 Tax=Variovorax sp. DT-64 TaxID=3396160 RepID=UPI003F1A7702
MPLLLRHVLVRLLLLTVFFNTVIGMPAHEAEHLQQTTVAAWSAHGADEDADASEHGEEAHGACAWCFAYAHLGAALTSPATVHATAWQADTPRPRAPETFVPAAGRWRFASRDPPHTDS